jgi:hypothetical protein
VQKSKQNYKAQQQYKPRGGNNDSLATILRQDDVKIEMKYTNTADSLPADQSVPKLKVDKISLLRPIVLRDQNRISSFFGLDH